MNRRNKIATLWSDYHSTQALNIGRVRFAFYYWLTKLATFLKRALPGLDMPYMRVRPERSFTIHNKRGIFLVQPYDDSMTTCSNYFEADIIPWLSIPKSKGIFIDVGSNRGIYTVLALTTYGFTRAIAFEPNPHMVETLTQNMKLNAIEHSVEIHPIALGEKKHIAELSYDPAHTGGGRLSKTEGVHMKTITVEVNTLDAVFSNPEKESVSVIKIDVEGYELGVLKGATNTLSFMPEGSALVVETKQPDVLTNVLTPFGFKYCARIGDDTLYIKNVTV